MATETMTIDHQRFDQLWQAHLALREEFDALLRRLKISDVLSSAQPQRERCCTAPELASGGPPPTLLQALEPLVLQAIAQCCGVDEFLALKAACTASRRRAGAAQGGRLYVFGGWGPGRWRVNVLKAVECFDLTKGTWEAMPAMQVARYGHVAGAIGGDVYVCGGIGEFGRIVEKFNFRMRKWKTRTPPPRLSVVRAHAAAAVIDGRFYICGGEDRDAGIVHSSVECFDPRRAYGKGACEVLPFQMSAARRHHAAVACPVPGQPDMLLVCGGKPLVTAKDEFVTTSGERVLSSSETLNVSDYGSTWQQTARMTRPRCCHSAASLRSSIFVCGGTHGDGSMTSTVDRYDLLRSCWISMPRTLIDRGASSAAVLADRLYVVGHMARGKGVSGGWWCAGSRAECFDPAEERWEWIPDMHQARHSFAMVAVKLGGPVGPSCGQRTCAEVKGQDP